MALLDMLQDVYNAYEEYVSMVNTIDMIWADASGNCNPGQFVLASDYAIPSGQSVLTDWDTDWPFVEPGEYADAILDSHERMEDAWSQTVDECVSVIQDAKERAGGYQFE